jgi:iron complex outermembrane receptor protein
MNCSLPPDLPLQSCRHRRTAFAASIAAAVVAPSLFCAPASAQEASEAEETEEVEEIVVQATRSGRRVQDEAIRVEVIDREEIEEKLLMTPGNISMLVAETGGLRVQVTSPALGASNVRVRGLEGRYTQILADGLPLYGQTSSIGLLQIAPTDLGRVEVIKGAASALYGPSALGGVINLVARRPGEAVEAEALLNATSRDGQDATAYAASPLGGGWGYSVVGGYHRQSRQDLDGDGWADMPGYDRATFRPRLFWDGADSAKALLTIGAMTEERVGGTLPGRSTPDGLPFPQEQDSRRFDAGLVSQFPFLAAGMLHLRASVMRQDHQHRFGTLVEEDRHGTMLAETSFAAGSDRTSWLVGAAVQRDSFRSETFPVFDYTYTVPGLFAQVEHQAIGDLLLSASARFDAHSAYGSHFSPRLSALYRPGPWTIRASLGRGFFAPTPFVDEIEAAGLSRLEPLAGLRAEKANTASIDIGYAFGRTELIAALFASDVDHEVRLEPAGPERVRLTNVEGVTRTRGVELLARHRWDNFSITGSYVHVDATEPDTSGSERRTVPRTPRHTGGLVAMWEKHGKGRIGIEAYYTGRQRLEDNPYREVGRPYVELGMLAEIVLGRASLFLNLENILDVRQTKYDPLLLPRRARDGRWTVDVWAPTDGFVANGGVRLRFGKTDH